MLYNLKITEYNDTIQVSLYDKNIIRSDSNDKKNIKSNEFNNCSVLQHFWYNSKSCKMEIIPDGFHVEIDPFTSEEVLCFDIKSEEEKSKEYIRNIYRSLRRTKQNVYNIARGSKWDLFITLTIADNSIRYDIDQCKKRVGSRIHDIKKSFAPDLKYLLIFERHPSSGAWHVHGLLKDISGLHLEKAFNPHTGEIICKNDKQIYNIKDFDVIGFSTASYIEDNNKVTQYILKYITKDMAFEFPDKKSYLCSKGLPRGIEEYYIVDNEDDIDDILSSSFGYLPRKTHAKKGFNIYNGANILYEQYKKEEVDNNDS